MIRAFQLASYQLKYLSRPSLRMLCMLSPHSNPHSHNQALAGASHSHRTTTHTKHQPRTPQPIDLNLSFHTLFKMASIASARYGKDNVRVYKVERDEKTGVQTVTEMTVCVLLEGAIDVSYVVPQCHASPNF